MRKSNDHRVLHRQPIFVNQRKWYKPNYAAGRRYSLNSAR